MRRSIHRRTFLRGAGTVAIGLPFLEEMTVRKARAAGEEIPSRLVTLSFGLGIPAELAELGFDGPLQPLQPFASKLACLSGLDMSQAHTYGSGTTHFKTGDVLFVGEPQKNEYTAAGPSLEQLMLGELHPMGAPTRLSSLSAGLWFTYGAPSRYVCHWNYDGSPGPAPDRRPSRLFARLFGEVTPGADVDARTARVKRSILDTVLEEYRFAIGDRSYLGAESKAKLKIHLDGIRNVEKRLVPSEAELLPDTPGCSPPDAVSDPSGLPYDQETPDTPQPPGVFKPHSAPMEHTTYLEVFRLQAELFALALRCDLTRFGSLLLTDKGGNLQFKGKYTGAAVGTIDFDLETATDSIHNELFHRQRLPEIAQYQHFCMSGVAAALAAFDDPLFLEANGKTLLDNTLVVIGTEYGLDHGLSGVFHALAGGHGHFKAGFFSQQANVIDFYDTLLKPYGIQSGIGTRHATFKYTPEELTAILA
ncbi:MAG TPA: DUF1552 domain-containing protein [Polyangiaceae bacterium]|jgi:hypothetical protein|nr:DUF1552 domain-containing protein [Polyangiaceae bacterium]